MLQQIFPTRVGVIPVVVCLCFFRFSFPTRVGVILADCQFWTLTKRLSPREWGLSQRCTRCNYYNDTFSHASGGYPACRSLIVSSRFFSPREWGLSPMRIEALCSAALFPTRVGLSQLKQASERAEALFPTRVGVILNICQRRTTYKYLSPREWGLSYLSGHTSGDDGLFPTRVGLSFFR